MQVQWRESSHMTANRRDGGLVIYRSVFLCTAHKFTARGTWFGTNLGAPYYYRVRSAQAQECVRSPSTGYCDTTLLYCAVLDYGLLRSIILDACLPCILLLSKQAYSTPALQ